MVALWVIVRLTKDIAEPSTDATTLSRVTSDFGFWPLRNRIEKFGLGRIPKASEKVRPQPLARSFRPSLTFLLPPHAGSRRT